MGGKRETRGDKGGRKTENKRKITKKLPNTNAQYRTDGR